MDERDDINKYREKVKRKKLTVRLVIFVVVTAALIVIVLNWRSIIAPFRNIAGKSGTGYPISITSSANYIMGAMGDNIYLLTDTYLYTYNDSGAELLDKQHGLQNPVCSSNGKRALVYSKNGKELKVYSKNSEVFSKSFEDSIVFAEMGTDERCAIVTTSSRYFNYLYVLNSEGKQIFRWASPDEKIMQVCFGDGDRYVYVSVVGEKDGTLSSAVMKFSVSEGESELWRASTGNSVSYFMEKYPDGVYTVTPEGAFLIDDSTGDIKASNSYTKEVCGIAGDDGIRATFFRDQVSNGELVDVYDGSLQPSAALSLEDMTAYDVKGDKLYILRKNILTVYNSGLEKVKEYSLDDEYSDLKIIGKYAYLLGYNMIQRQELA